MTDKFDSNSYWRERHERFRQNSQGVGNVSFTEEENDAIYEQARDRMAAIVGVLGLDASASVLDLGCGIGMISPVFLHQGMHYVGVDISDVAIEIAAANNPEGRFVCEDIAELKLDTKFDFVLERTVFIHLVDENKWRSALRTVKSHLAEHGVFLVQDKIPAEDEVPAAHVLFRSEASWSAGLADAGLCFDDELAARIKDQLPNENIRPVVHLSDDRS